MTFTEIIATQKDSLRGWFVGGKRAKVSLIVWTLRDQEINQWTNHGCCVARVTFLVHGEA